MSKKNWTTKTIRVDPEVYKELKKRADPFEDSPNDVIRRVLFPQEGKNPTLKKPT